jgi:hypothetical protein
LAGKRFGRSGRPLHGVDVETVAPYNGAHMAAEVDARAVCPTRENRDASRDRHRNYSCVFMAVEVKMTGISGWIKVVGDRVRAPATG